LVALPWSCRYATCMIDLRNLGWDDEAFGVAFKALQYIAEHCKFEGKPQAFLDYGFHKSSEIVRLEWDMLRDGVLKESNPLMVQWISMHP
jgi:hypothetical protein